MVYCLSSLLRFKWTSVAWLRIALLRADSIQIGFCRKSLGFELLWFLHWKYISYSLIYFAARPDYSCRWVESNFVAGCKNSFEVGSKIVFFGLLWFLSLFRGIRIATDWNSISCYVTISNNTILLCVLPIYKQKQMNPFLPSSLCSLIQILMGQTLIFLHAPSVFISKRLWLFRRFNWQNVFPRRLSFQNCQINGTRTSGEINHLKLKLKLKLTLVESTYPSRRTHCPSLSPHFLLNRWLSKL